MGAQSSQNPLPSFIPSTRISRPWAILTKPSNNPVQQAMYGGLSSNKEKAPFFPNRFQHTSSSQEPIISMAPPNSSNTTKAAAPLDCQPLVNNRQQFFGPWSSQPSQPDQIADNSFFANGSGNNHFVGAETQPSSQPSQVAARLLEDLQCKAMATATGIAPTSSLLSEIRDKLEAFITIHDSQAATHQQIQTNIIEKLDQHYENSNSSSHNFQEKIFAQLSSLSSLVLELSVKLEAHENKIFSTLGHIMKQQKEHETSLVALLSAYESGGLKNCHTILDSMLQQHPFPAKHLQDQPVNIQTRIKASSALHAGLQKMNTRSATKKRTRQPHFHDDDDVCSHADDDEKSSNSNPYKRVPHYHQVPFFQAFSQKESVGNTSIEIIDLVTDKDMGDITDDDKVSDAVSPRLARRLARHLKASIESKRLFLKPEQ